MSKLFLHELSGMADKEQAEFLAKYVASNVLDEAVSIRSSKDTRIFISDDYCSVEIDTIRMVSKQIPCYLVFSFITGEQYAVIYHDNESARDDMYEKIIQHLHII